MMRPQYPDNGLRYERMGEGVRFEKLVVARIKDGTDLVISLRSDGKISIAQCVEMKSGEKTMQIFLKNAIEITPDVLFIVRDAFNKAISALFVLEDTAVEQQGA